jgi:enediyne biosynthesis protein E4
MYATALVDINGDGHLDLLTGGNLKKTRVSSGQQDANFGFVFLGDGLGNFKAQNAASTGVLIRGDVRDIQVITIQGITHALYSVNNGKMQVYALNP